MGTKHRHIAMSPEELPRQRLFRVTDLPQPPHGFEVIQGPALERLGPKEPGAETGFILQAEWSWSPMHQRISNWEIGPDDTGQYWLLWASDRTDECELADWCDPDDDEEDQQFVSVWVSQLVAACSRGSLCERDASIWLLVEAWAAERDSEWELDRPHFYGDTGLLDVDVIRSIECAVWPPRQR